MATFNHTTRVKNIFYCKECNQVYNQCYELQGMLMCPECFSDDIRELQEEEIQKFIRYKRLENLKNKFDD